MFLHARTLASSIKSSSLVSKAQNFWLPFFIFPVKVLRVDEENLLGLGSRAGMVIGKDRLTPLACSLIPVTNLRALFSLR